MEYNEQTHAKRVLRILSGEVEKPCSASTCPGHEDLRLLRPSEAEDTPTFIMWRNELRKNICPVCREFSGITNLKISCPCLVLGHARNIKNAWLKLEELGMLD